MWALRHRSLIHVVQASVIVQDKNGRPATGFTKDDLVLLVGGKEREISIFSEETATLSKTPPEPLPPGLYSNGGVVAHRTVEILSFLAAGVRAVALLRRADRKMPATAA
jgi:hypothetical protein